MLVVGLVTLIATIHYYYMRDLWVNTGESPIVYRYIDWLLTVPLQMIEFYLILIAAGLAVSSSVFWRLLIGTLVMLLGGYAGENGWISPTLGFVIGMAGWIFIVFEIFRGESNAVATKNESVKYAFRAMGLIVVIGWSIYPIGYIFGLLTPMIGLGTANLNFLNITYNLADFVNKILFASDWPISSPKDNITGLRNLNKFANKYNLPRIPDIDLEEIINRNGKK